MAGDTIGLITPGSVQAVPFAGISLSGGAGDNGPAVAATFRTPSGVAVGRDGSVYIADRLDYRVRRIGTDGVIRPFAGTGQYGSSGDGGPAAQAQLAGPQGMAMDASGNLYIAESKSTVGRIRMVTPDGTISTILGGGSTEVISLAPGPFPSVPATSAQISYPAAVAIGPNGTLFVLAFDSASRIAGILRLTPDGRVMQIYRWSANPLSYVSLAVDADGNVYTNGAVISPNGSSSADAALVNFDNVRGAAFDSTGNRYLYTLHTGQLAKLTKGGAHGTIYNADLKGFSGETGLNSAAQHIQFAAMTADADGTVYIADVAERVRKLEAGTCPVTPAPIIRGFGTAWARYNPSLPAWLAPGSLVSIYGAGIGPDRPEFATLDANGNLSKQIGGVRVLFNGVPSPLLYVSSTQVNTVAPFSVLRDQVFLEVERDGVRSDAWLTSASPAALSIFPSAINEDGTLNSQTNPGRAGSVVTIWVSGLGFTDPTGVDGLPAPLPLGRPVLPVSIDLGQTEPAEILYVGNAPGVVEGVMQINFRIPNQGTFRSTAMLTVGSDTTRFSLYF